jgi:hypothetical protein
MKSKLPRVSNEWTEAVFGAERLVIRALVVADRDLTFNCDPTGFSLTLFVDALKQRALPWETIEVVTAHREPEPFITGADLRGFKFDALVDGVPVLHITRFDQVWLFGDAGEQPEFGITPAELDVITEFMNKGGGVFATGDHEDLGSAMSGNVPRVRRMRRWHVTQLSRGERPAPSRNESTRIDTLREGLEPGFEEADERDAIPQEIRPKFFVNETRTGAEPHELLAAGKFAIAILPDHMHEGECVSADEIKKNQLALEDFPVRRETGERVLPETVAIASSAGGAFFRALNILPVDPRCYIVISAYDGHLVEFTDDGGAVSKLGRVVVDASFHHFLNVNLDGFIKDGVRTKEFEIFAQYYRNILHYLLPPEKQRLYFLHLLRALRFSPPLQEDLKQLSVNNWEHVVYAGALTRKAISDDFSSAHARRCALAMISDVGPDLRKALEDMLDLWQSRDRTDDDSLFFVNSEAILISVLGKAILGIASNLPLNHYEVSRKLIEFEAGGISFQKLVTESLQQGIKQIQERVGRSGQHLERFSKL